MKSWEKLWPSSLAAGTSRDLLVYPSGEGQQQVLDRRILPGPWRVPVGLLRLGQTGQRTAFRSCCAGRGATRGDSGDPQAIPVLWFASDPSGAPQTQAPGGATPGGEVDDNPRDQGSTGKDQVTAQVCASETEARGRRSRQTRLRWRNPEPDLVHRSDDDPNRSRHASSSGDPRLL